MSDDWQAGEVELRGHDGSDEGSSETRAAIVTRYHDHLVVELETPDSAGREDLPRVVLQWVPGEGWEVLVLDAGNEEPMTVQMPDGGKPYLGQPLTRGLRRVP